MIKKFRLFFLCASLFYILGQFFYDKFLIYSFEKYPEKPIHIFYESSATQPELMGMIDLVQLPADELKIFGWHRFPKRSELYDLKKINAIEIPITPREGFQYINGAAFVKQLKPYLDEHPKAPVIVYTNMNNYAYFFRFFAQTEPLDRIKAVHLYEDGVGELITFAHFFSQMPEDLTETAADLKSFILGTSDKKTPYIKYAYQHIFPTTYHFFGLNQIRKNPLYQSFFKAMKQAELSNTDYKLLYKKLTPKQKAVFFKLVGFEYEHYKRKAHNKKIFMFIGGFHEDGRQPMIHAELNYLSQLIKKYPNYYFYFKSHPSMDSYNRIKLLKELFPRVEFVDSRLPYEVFLIAGFEPDKIAGWGSSLFYSVSDNHLEGVFPHGAYINGFKMYNRFSNHKYINPNHFVSQKPLYYDYLLRHESEDDHLILLNEKSAYVWEKNKIYFFEKKGNNLILEEKNKKPQKIIYELKEDVYYFVSGEETPTVYVIHPHWTGRLEKIEENFYCRQGSNDCGTVTEQSNGFKICWERWGCEQFEQQKDGSYRLKK